MGHCFIILVIPPVLLIHRVLSQLELRGDVNDGSCWYVVVSIIQACLRFLRRQYILPWTWAVTEAKEGRHSRNKELIDDQLLSRAKLF